MSKTTPVPEEIRKSIVSVRKTHPDWSERTIADCFGLHHKTVGRILQNTPTPEISKPELKESSTVEGDKWTISLPQTRIHTLEELVKQFDIDLALWEIERFIANSWEVGIKVGKGDDARVKTEPLYQVKAFLKKRVEVEDARNEVEELKKLAEGWAPTPEPERLTVYPDDLMLEVNFPDSHLGKLAWGAETGHGNYDVKIAEHVYWEALETILDRTRHHRFNQILFVIGNDLLNSDDIEGRTTAGTYVSSDARYHKTFAAVRTLMIDAVERIRKVAPVKVIIVSGNHDQLSAWHLGDSLECFFHKYEDEAE